MYVGQKKERRSLWNCWDGKMRMRPER